MSMRSGRLRMWDLVECSLVLLVVLCFNLSGALRSIALVGSSNCCLPLGRLLQQFAADEAESLPAQAVNVTHFDRLEGILDAPAKFDVSLICACPVPHVAHSGFDDVSPLAFRTFASHSDCPANIWTRVGDTRGESVVLVPIVESVFTQIPYLKFIFQLCGFSRIVNSDDFFVSIARNSVWTYNRRLLDSAKEFKMRIVQAEVTECLKRTAKCEGNLVNLAPEVNNSHWWVSPVPSLLRASLSKAFLSSEDVRRSASFEKTDAMNGRLTEGEAHSAVRVIVPVCRNPLGAALMISALFFHCEDENVRVDALVCPSIGAQVGDSVMSELTRYMCQMLTETYGSQHFQCVLVPDHVNVFESTSLPIESVADAGERWFRSGLATDTIVEWALKKIATSSPSILIAVINPEILFVRQFSIRQIMESTSSARRDRCICGVRRWSQMTTVEHTRFASPQVHSSGSYFWSGILFVNPNACLAGSANFFADLTLTASESVSSAIGAGALPAFLLREFGGTGTMDLGSKMGGKWIESQGHFAVRSSVRCFGNSLAREFWKIRMESARGIADAWNEDVILWDNATLAVQMNLLSPGEPRLFSISVHAAHEKMARALLKLKNQDSVLGTRSNRIWSRIVDLVPKLLENAPFLQDDVEEAHAQMLRSLLLNDDPSPEFRSDSNLLNHHAATLESKCSVDSCSEDTSEGKYGILPDFIIAGVQKAATTWLSCVLAAHPDVWIPRFPGNVQQRVVKNRASPGVPIELHAFDIPARFAGLPYGAHFSCNAALCEKRDAIVVGEKTPEYLYFPESLHLMRKRAPNARIIVLLREPFSRMISAMKHIRNAFAHPEIHEALHFGEIIASEITRLRQGLHLSKTGPSRTAHRSHNDIVRRSCYAEQLDHLFNLYERENVKILFTENAQSAHAVDTVSDVLKFVGATRSSVDLRKLFSYAEAVGGGECARRSKQTLRNNTETTSSSAAAQSLRTGLRDIKMNSQDWIWLREYYSSCTASLKELLQPEQAIALDESWKELDQTAQVEIRSKIAEAEQQENLADTENAESPMTDLCSWDTVRVLVAPSYDGRRGRRQVGPFGALLFSKGSALMASERDFGRIIRSVLNSTRIVNVNDLRKLFDYDISGLSQHLRSLVSSSMSIWWQQHTMRQINGVLRGGNRAVARLVPCMMVLNDPMALLLLPFIRSRARHVMVLHLVHKERETLKCDSLQLRNVSCDSIVVDVLMRNVAHNGIDVPRVDILGFNEDEQSKMRLQISSAIQCALGSYGLSGGAASHIHEQQCFNNPSNGTGCFVYAEILSDSRQWLCDLAAFDAITSTRWREGVNEIEWGALSRSNSACEKFLGSDILGQRYSHILKEVEIIQQGSHV